MIAVMFTSLEAEALRQALADSDHNSMNPDLDEALFRAELKLGAKPHHLLYAPCPPDPEL